MSARFEIVHTDDPDQRRSTSVSSATTGSRSSENLTSLDAAHTNIAAQAKALGLVPDGMLPDIEIRMVDVRAGSEVPD